MLGRKKQVKAASQPHCVDDVLLLIADSGGLMKVRLGSPLLQNSFLDMAEHHRLINRTIGGVYARFTFTERGAVVALATQHRRKIATVSAGAPSGPSRKNGA